MKRKVVKYLALLLAFLMVVSVASCAAKAKPMLTHGEHTLSVNIFSLMLSIQKGNMAPAIYASYGDYDSETFWGTVIEGSSTTFNDYYTYAVYGKAERYLSAMVLFDELKLSLPKSTMDKIDEEMKAFVENDGEGSKNRLNEILSVYGANYDILREYKIMEAKVAYLAEHLYGKGGSMIGASIKDKYFEENYVAFKQILLSNVTYVYKTDKNGDDIYYTENGSIAYDTEKGTAKLEGDKFVYYLEDGSIAYDKENGKRSPVLDKDGNPTTKKYTTDQMLDRLNQALSLKELAESESAEVFETLRQMYSDEEFDKDHNASLLNYLAANVDYQSISSAYSTFDKLADKLATMELGEIAIVQTDAGIHVVRRYPLENGAYSNSDYTQWFSDSTYAVYDFNGNLLDELFTERLSAYSEDIVVDKELLGSISLRSAVPNYDFK